MIDDHTISSSTVIKVYNSISFATQKEGLTVLSAGEITKDQASRDGGSVRQ